MDIKRLFFGMEVVAPWPEEFPQGRVLLESDRHLTLAFLGDADLPRLQSLLSTFPRPSFSIGLAGFFDEPVFLPPRTPRVAAWHVQWLEGEGDFLRFQKEIADWLKGNGLSLKEKKGEFLSHVTIARSPFSIHEWRDSFEKLPLFVRNVHLCKSLVPDHKSFQRDLRPDFSDQQSAEDAGNLHQVVESERKVGREKMGQIPKNFCGRVLGHSRYEICWSFPILPPFEEIEHTADIAFLVRGSDFSQLYLHAQLALSFYFPPLLGYFSKEECSSIDEAVSALNRVIANVDQDRGSPFKAVSFHSALKKNEILEWEMIADV